MKKLRGKFWKESKALIDWCEDEELRVLYQKAKKELDARLTALTAKYDAQDETKKQIGRDRAKKHAAPSPLTYITESK
jgi:hypothetical protein